MKELSNGTKILMLNNFNKIEYFKKTVLRIMNEKNIQSVNYDELAEYFKISPDIAKIILNINSQNGFLVVDDHIEGKFYFRNDIIPFKL